MEEELYAAFGADVPIELIGGGGGVYEIMVDGKKIFSKKQLSRFPNEGEIVGLIKG